MTNVKIISLLLTVNYNHKALHLGCCNSPRSAAVKYNVISTEVIIPKITQEQFIY